MRKLFGTDGIRGAANVYPMTCEVAMALGRAVTCYFQRKKKNHRPLIIIGKDTRISCYMLELAFASGVCSQGGRAILTGPLPTPAVAFVIESMRADAGVMISASHNVFSDNGIKIFDHCGHKLPDEVEYELEQLIFNTDEIVPKTGGELGSAQRLDEVIGRYIVQAKMAFDSQKSLEGLRLVIDCANGAAYKVAPMIFSELGAEVIPLGISPNGRNINDHAGAMHPEYAATQVVKYRADLGICLDGDGDRLVVVDQRGEVVHGDRLIGLCARFLKERGELNGAEVVGTTMSNMGLENYLKGLGIPFYRTKVGDRYILERMLNSGSMFGGEPSGHLIFRRYAKTGDGLISALKVLECLLHYKKPLSDLIEEIPLYPQILRNITVKDRVPLEDVAPLMEAEREAALQLGDKGRVVLRYSGTEPKVRVMVEGACEQEVFDVAARLEAIVRKELT